MSWSQTSHLDCITCRLCCRVQLYNRCLSMTKHKRNLAIAGGVISSVLLSPVLAALAVGQFACCHALDLSLCYCLYSVTEASFRSVVLVVMVLETKRHKTILNMSR